MRSAQQRREFAIRLSRQRAAREMRNREAQRRRQAIGEYAEPPRRKAG